MRKSCFISVAYLIVIASCKNLSHHLFTKVSSSHSGISFNNAITESDTLNPLNYDYIYNGGGVAIADFNGDGNKDIFFTGNMVPAKLYLNKGDFKFEDITKPSGVTTNGWTLGVSVIDINQDGLMDIYICNAVVPRLKSLPTANQLFVNQGNTGERGIPVFKEMANDYGLADKNYSCQAAFFDYDADGDLDMYLLTNSIDYNNRNIARPKLVNGENINTDHLYRNEGNIKNGHPFYKDVSKEAGILIEGAGLGLAISDFNQDGWPDVYCSNDYLSNDLLWINNQDGTFTNKIDQYMKHQSYNGMGVDVADINNDGLQDVMVADMLPEDNKRKKMMLWKYNYDFFQSTLKYDYEPQYIRNTLQLNNGLSQDSAAHFSEIGQLAGVHQTDWSWAPLMMDFDNDSYRDIVIANGYRRDITNLDFIVYLNDVPVFGNSKENRLLRHKEEVKKLYTLPEIKLHNYIYKNKGDLSFDDKSIEWGLEEKTYSNGCAYGDLDNDGDIDMVFNNMDAEAGLYKNTLNDKKTTEPSANWVSFKLKGLPGNWQAIGATLKIFYDTNKTQLQENYPIRGYQSSVSDVLHFGLGVTSVIDSAIVIWPNRTRQIFKNITVNKENTFSYTSSAQMLAEPVTPAGYFTQADSSHTGISYTHQYKDVNDFNVTTLLPHLLSKNGPGIAVGDADGNGLDDFFAGGDIGQQRKIFLQTTPGKFKSKVLTASPAYSDMASIFFDADGDGDNDLYIVSGGSSKTGEDEIYRDRLFLNDGKANFSLTVNSLPAIQSSGSCIIAGDIDKDGDLDLFRGGMISAGNYPAAPRSFLLRNDSKKGLPPIFTDITPEPLKKIGTVSTALFTNTDNDGSLDLMLTGEWMPLVIFKNANGKFNSFTNVENSNGWWNSLTACDVDMDGDMDYVAGNFGHNSKYKASVKEPVELYLSDFDNNGTTEPIITQYAQGIKYVVPLRDAIADQMPSIKKRFAEYLHYAEADFENTFTKKEIDDSKKFTAQVLATCIFINNGKGNFNMKALPVRGQFSSVYGAATDDFNNDGNPDILLTGNFYSPESQTGWNDASIGCLLTGDGKGNFFAASPSLTGFCLDKDAKALAQINTGANSCMYLLTNHNGPLQCLKSNADSAFNFIKIQADDNYALRTQQNGTQQKIEFSYGNSYLSQSSRYLKVKKDDKLIEVTNYTGKKRVVINK